VNADRKQQPPMHTDGRQREIREQQTAGGWRLSVSRPRGSSNSPRPAVIYNSQFPGQLSIDCRIKGTSAGHPWSDPRADLEFDFRVNVGADFEADSGADFCPDSKPDLRTDFGADLDRDSEADVGADLRADLESDFAADLNCDLGADVGRDLKAYIGTDSWVDLVPTGRKRSTGAVSAESCPRSFESARSAGDYCLSSSDLDSLTARRSLSTAHFQPVEVHSSCQLAVPPVSVIW
jgi:hypothetical protein